MFCGGSIEDERRDIENFFHFVKFTPVLVGRIPNAYNTVEFYSSEDHNTDVRAMFNSFETRLRFLPMVISCMFFWQHDETIQW